MKFRLLLSIVAFLKASLPLPIHKFMNINHYNLFTVTETLTSAGIYSPCFKQPVLFGTICCFSIRATIVWLCQHVPTAGERGNKQGMGGGLTRPLPVLSSPAARNGTRRSATPCLRCPWNGLWAWEGAGCTRRHPSMAMRAPFGDYRTCLGRSYCTALTLTEESTNYLVMEKRCTRITWRNCTAQKCYYSKIGICNFFVIQFGATFADTQSSWSAPGLYLKRTFAHEQVHDWKEHCRCNLLTLIKPQLHYGYPGIRDETILSNFNALNFIFTLLKTEFKAKNVYSQTLFGGLKI